MVSNPPKGAKIRAALGQSIKRLRKEREWTQERAAEKADMSLRYYQELERGDAWPSEMMMENICDAFSVTSEQLFKIPGFDMAFKVLENALTDLHSKESLLNKMIGGRPELRKLLEIATPMDHNQVLTLLAFAVSIRDQRKPEELRKELNNLVRKKRSSKL
jgi:transcriptional regulator with XRE-family HTH domain